MMKPKIRSLWMQWHAYLACFFLPLSLLYATTGALYLLDIKGGSKASYSYMINAPWPDSQQEAETLVIPTLNKEKHKSLPTDYHSKKDSLAWFGFGQDVLLSKTKDPSTLELSIDEHDFWKQLVFIHKGHAGLIFVVFGVVLGINLIFSLVSGVVLAFNLPKYKNNSILAISLGLLSIVIAFFAS